MPCIITITNLLGLYATIITKESVKQLEKFYGNMVH